MQQIGCITGQALLRRTGKLKMFHILCPHCGEIIADRAPDIFAHYANHVKAGDLPIGTAAAMKFLIINKRGCNDFVRRTFPDVAQLAFEHADNIRKQRYAEKVVVHNPATSPKLRAPSR